MKYAQNIPFYITKFKDYPWKIYESDHYIFHVEAESLAEKDIEEIKTRQEMTYTKIIQTLKLQKPDQKIKYYFYPSQDKKAEFYYSIAGSFIKYLLDILDLQTFKELYSGMNRKNSTEENIKVFELNLKTSMKDTETKWKE